jgi:hypothetical protein
MAIPLLGAAAGAAARMAAKKLAKKSTTKNAKKTDRELDEEATRKFEKDLEKATRKEESKPFKGHSLRGSEGKTGKGYRDYETGSPRLSDEMKFKKGGSVKSSASKRADGIAVKGKTRGRIV